MATILNDPAGLLSPAGLFLAVDVDKKGKSGYKLSSLINKNV
jgi:hypothetical protein